MHAPGLTSPVDQQLERRLPRLAAFRHLLHASAHPAHCDCRFIGLQNIDTDQIIPAEYLTLVPSKPDE